MVQINNGYDWAVSDHTYTNKLADILQTKLSGHESIDQRCSQRGASKNGQVPGALAVYDVAQIKAGVSIQ
jgi:hypothetical protein